MMFEKYNITTGLELYDNIVSFMQSAGFTLVATDEPAMSSATKSSVFLDMQQNDSIMVWYTSGDLVYFTFFTGLDTQKLWNQQDNVLNVDGTPAMLSLSLPSLTNASDASNGAELHCLYNNNTAMFSIIDTTYVRETHSIAFGQLIPYTNTFMSGDLFVICCGTDSFDIGARMSIDSNEYSWVTSKSTRTLESSLSFKDLQIPTYYALYNDQLLQGRTVNTLNCASLIMPIIFYVKRDPVVLNNYSAIGYTDIVNYVNMFNMSSGHIEKSNVPVEGNSYSCFYMDKRRIDAGFPGIAFKREDND